MCFFSLLEGQNRFDPRGEKTGYWVARYPDGGIRYESEFVAGKPVGLMKQYHQNGSLSAEMMFDTTGNRCFARLYRPNKMVAAEGWYTDQKKDSVWTYFSEAGEQVIMREPYVNGHLEGTVEHYYHTGQLAGQTAWKDSIRNGESLLFFENGNVRSRGTYVNGLREGAYDTYYPEGNPELSGNYLRNVADGDWTLYNEDGSVLFIFKYRAGKLLNESELLNSEDDILRKLQEVSDPEQLSE